MPAIVFTFSSNYVLDRQNKTTNSTLYVPNINLYRLVIWNHSENYREYLKLNLVLYIKRLIGQSIRIIYTFKNVGTKNFKK